MNNFENGPKSTFADLGGLDEVGRLTDEATHCQSPQIISYCFE
jgi:hypothetical protein